MPKLVVGGMADAQPSSAGPDRAPGPDAPAAGDVAGPEGHGLGRRDPAVQDAAPDVARQAQRMEALADVAGGVAHEFNNLLTVVLANLEPLGRGADERTVRRLTRASDAVRRAARLTQQVLAFARRQPLEVEEVDLREVLTGLDALAGQAAGSGVRFLMELPDRPVLARLDAGQLEVALLRLVRLVRAAMPEDGELRVALSEGADGACILVAGTRNGMAPEEAARAAGPSSGTHDPGQGVDLGLSMVSGFAARSGGSVQVSSVPGQGTQVALRFPCAGASGGG